ncbi:hypothetical protein HII31_09898 [Pseudocercospora fuligena]|uniref:Uncharacterized protein n=1 Tax=Pseudocercospora fuligena TaxID=685502 RepID=A0A8H6VJG1_9PEZI|nr:hypothetical protein HII31_09898 [Pseudocercospora fuligena]
MAETSDDVLLTGGNEITAYYALDEAMMTAHREENNEKAIGTARVLLEYPELPLQLRARACMVLGCSDESDFLDMAKEAVRIAELALARCDGAQAGDDISGEVNDANQPHSASTVAGVTGAEDEGVKGEASTTQQKKTKRLHTDPSKATVPAEDPPPIERRRSQRIKDLEGSGGSEPSAASRPRRVIEQTTALPTGDEHAEDAEEQADAMDVE